MLHPTVDKKALDLETPTLAEARAVGAGVGFQGGNNLMAAAAGFGGGGSSNGSPNSHHHHHLHNRRASLPGNNSNNNNNNLFGSSNNSPHINNNNIAPVSPLFDGSNNNPHHQQLNRGLSKKDLQKLNQQQEQLQNAIQQQQMLESSQNLGGDRKGKSSTNTRKFSTSGSPLRNNFDGHHNSNNNNDDNPHQQQNPLQMSFDQFSKELVKKNSFHGTNNTLNNDHHHQSGELRDGTTKFCPALTETNQNAIFSNNANNTRINEGETTSNNNNNDSSFSGSQSGSNQHHVLQVPKIILHDHSNKHWVPGKKLQDKINSIALNGIAADSARERFVHGGNNNNNNSNDQKSPQEKSPSSPLTTSQLELVEERGKKLSKKEIRRRQQELEDQKKRAEMEDFYRKRALILRGQLYELHTRHDSLYYFSANDHLRRTLFMVIDSMEFEYALLAIIFINFFAMIFLASPEFRTDTTLDILLAIEITVQVLYTLEAAIKMLALGVIVHDGSYFSYRMNQLDFSIVIIGFAAFLVSDSRTARSLHSLRCLRCFRVLISLAHVAELRAISTTFTTSAAKLRDVLILMAFVVISLAVLGLQLFVGDIERKCYRFVPDSVYSDITNVTNGDTSSLIANVNASFSWHELYPEGYTPENFTLMLDIADQNILCTKDNVSGHVCASGAQCIKNAAIYDDPYLNFNNIGNALLYVLKMVTQDNWPADTSKFQQSNGLGFFIFSFVVIITATYFCLNLVLAIMSSGYEDATHEAMLLQLAAEHDATLNADREDSDDDDASSVGADDEDDQLAAHHQLSVIDDKTEFEAQEDEELYYEELQKENETASPKSSKNNKNNNNPSSDGAASTGPEKATNSTDPQQREETIYKQARRLVRTFTELEAFGHVMLGVTLVNVMVLMLDYHGIQEAMSNVLDTINFVCTMIFFVEMGLKLFGLGLLGYLSDNLNLFDGLLCLISIPELILSSSGGSSFSAFRAFRLARALRVVKSSKRLRVMIVTVLRAARASLVIFGLLFLYLACGSLIVVSFIPDAIQQNSRPNFTTFFDTLLALFIVLTGENWYTTASQAALGSSFAALIFFVCFFFIGNYLFLNFVIVILIANFEQSAEANLLDDEDEEENNNNNTEVVVNSSGSDNNNQKQKKNGRKNSPEKMKQDEVLGAVDDHENNKNNNNNNKSSSTTRRKSLASFDAENVNDEDPHHFDSSLNNNSNNNSSSPNSPSSPASEASLKSKVKKVIIVSSMGKPSNSSLNASGLLGASGTASAGGGKRKKKAFAISELTFHDRVDSDEDDQSPASIERKKRRKIAADKLNARMNQINKNENQNTNTNQAENDLGNVEFHDENEERRRRNNNNRSPDQGTSESGEESITETDNDDAQENNNSSVNIDRMIKQRNLMTFSDESPSRQEVVDVVDHPNNNNHNIELSNMNNNNTDQSSTNKKKRKIIIKKRKKKSRTNNVDDGGGDDENDIELRDKNNHNHHNSNCNKQIEDEEEFVFTDAIEAGCKSMYKSGKKFVEYLKEIADADNDPDIDPEATFFVFPRGHFLREACVTINSHWIFEILVYVMTLESCIALGFEAPGYSLEDSYEGSTIDRFLTVNTYMVPAFYGIETFVRMVAKGVIMYPTSYLRNAWNCVDFFVFITSIITIFVADLKFIRSFRIFRLASKIDSVKVVIETMVSIVPTMSNVVLLLLFVFIVFAVLGVQLFKGVFVKCTDPSITDRFNCTGTFIQYTPAVVTDPINFTSTYTIVETVQPRIWQHSFYNFNNVGNALLTLVLLMFSEAWSSVLYNGMDGVSYDVAMTRNNSPISALYFVAFMIVGNFFLYNLFVGSLMAAFGEEREKRSGILDSSGARLLTDAQQQWVRTYQIAQASDLQPRVQPPRNAVRQFFCWVYFVDPKTCTTPRTWLELIITLSIILNVIFLATVHDTQPAWWDDGLYVINLFFACIFLIEAVIKIFALMPRVYFGDSWNRFDFILVPIAFISVFVGGPGTSAIRVLRVARVLRLVKRAKGLQRLFNSLVHAAPQLLNVTVLLLLLLFVFGVIGTSLFGQVLVSDEDPSWVLTSYFNFQNAGNSMILLFQIATTENWVNVFAAAASTMETSNCDDALNNCGTVAAYPFFLIFMLVVNCVALNLFVYVIIDQYMSMNSNAAAQTTVLFERLNHFRDLWEYVDTKVTQHIPWEMFVLIMHRVFSIITTSVDTLEYAEIARIMAEEEEISKKLGAKSDLKLFRKFKAMDVPVDAKGRVSYRECILGLSREHFGLNDEETATAANLLNLPVPLDPSKTKHIVKIHHLLAVRTMQRRFRAQKQKRLQKQKEIADAFLVNNNSDLNNNEHGKWVRGAKLSIGKNTTTSPNNINHGVETNSSNKNRGIVSFSFSPKEDNPSSPILVVAKNLYANNEQGDFNFTSLQRNQQPTALNVSELQLPKSNNNSTLPSPSTATARPESKNKELKLEMDDNISPNKNAAQVWTRNPFTPPPELKNNYHNDDDDNNDDMYHFNTNNNNARVSAIPRVVSSTTSTAATTWKQDEERMRQNRRNNFDNDDAADAAGVVLPGAFVKEFRSPSPTGAVEERKNSPARSKDQNNNNNVSSSRYSPGQQQQQRNNNNTTTKGKIRIIDMKPKSFGKM